MPGTDNNAKFGIDLEGNAREVSQEITKSMLDAGASFKQAQDRARELQVSLRGLTGESKAVTDAKKQLNAALGVQKKAMTEASLAVQKHGFSMGTVLAKQNEMNKETKSLSDVVKGMGGPLSGAQGKLGELREMLSGASAGELALAGAAAAAVAAVVALTAVIVGGAVALSRWVLGAADAARSMQLLREGAVRASGNAANLGTQVDALSRKVPIAKSELNAMATEVYRAFNNTTASGATIVDVMNIVGQATAAAGGQVAKTFQDIVERGKRINRLQINPLELQGTGVSFQDVAAELAKQTGVGVKQAQLALFQGRVTLDAGAHALAAAVNARFAELNARKLLSFDSLIMKVHESIDSLASGVKVEPLGKAVKGLFDSLDSSTASGAALKQLVEVLGNGLVKGLVAAVPLVRGALLGVGIAALDVGIAVLKTAAWVKKAFGIDGATNVLTFEHAVTAAKWAIYSWAALMAIAIAPAVALGAALYGMWKGAELVADGLLAVGGAIGDLAKGAADLEVAAIKWGVGLVDGFIQGITDRWTAAQEAVKGLASGVSNAFKDALGIHSPSRVFQEHGGAIVEGLTGGLDAGRGAVQASADGLAPSPGSFGGSRASGGGLGGGGGKIELHVHIDAPGATGATVQKMSEPPFLAQLTHAIEHMLQASGVLTQTE